MTFCTFKSLSIQLLTSERDDRYGGRAAYVGNVHYTKGTFVGVIMDDPADGKNTGTVRGVEYFTCSGRQKGLMVALSDIKKA